jgi:protein-tyrosine phosphatase
VLSSCVQGKVTLVHCELGRNRSALVAARALMFWKDLRASEAIDLIRHRRSPQCLFNECYESWLRSFDR